ncbi:MAG TPA: winged helix DNA-binding domain-containing protein [Gemmatimonadales bacterium]|nr:winged helix DNA-binding domain-containing protein [Gemmatimonadales bacterium]
MRIPELRLDRQCLARPLKGAPAKVVSWFGAMQAQDYLAALWALGQRTAGATEATIEAAIADGAVLRTHAFRGTWQYIAREDVHWILDLVGARVIRGMASRFRELELDDRLLKRCGEAFARALEDGSHLTREEMAAVLERGRLSHMRPRLMHVLGHAELSGVIASGGRRGKQPTFALLAHRAPVQRRLVREEALAELAVRYFQSRGPATAKDFQWWIGLSLRDARLAIELAGKGLEARTVNDETYWMVPGKTAKPAEGARLLPAFDEYLVGYADRSAVLDPKFIKRVNAGGGILKPAVVTDGQVIGTWQRIWTGSSAVDVRVTLFKRNEEAFPGIREASKRYASFLGVSLAEKRPDRRK